MWPSKAATAILKIKQVDAVHVGKDGTHIWKLHWELFARPGNLLHEQDITLLEPCVPDGYAEIAEYLNNSLDNERFTQVDGDEVSRTIDAYRRSLFEELKLEKHVGALRGRCLEVHIWPKSRPGPASRSIHSIQWEHLEDHGLWAEDSQKGVQSVTVCRHVHVKSSRVSQTLTQARDGTFDVLLVVARPNVHGRPEGVGNEVSILNPGTVRSVLLQLQEELSSTDSSQQMRLEIVRPGCLKDLKRHLKDRERKFGGERPYKVVHLDMHGGVGKEGAFLVFNRYISPDHKLSTEPVYSSTLAELFYRHSIGCVIMNACKTAVAHAGPSANLSSVFLKRGISAVLAMSYNMHDSTSKRFYSKFYSELLVRHASISTAASKARKELFDNRTRWSYAKDAEFIMQDWFVPVVYTSSERTYRFSPPTWFSGTLFGIIPAVGSCLSLIASVFIYHLVSGKICRWLEYGAVYCPQPSIIDSKSHLRVIVVAPLSWPIVRMILHLQRGWRIRQQLRVLAEDRQNVLRIEVDLKKKKLVFFHSKEDVEEYARPFLNCLAAIWERTNFVGFGGTIDAEWFVQPCDLTFQDEWRLWMRACTNYVCLWVYNLKRQHFISTKDVKPVIIIENLDVLYPEEEVLKEMQYYASAQRRLESWLQTQLTAPRAPYLMLTALGGRALGENVSKWLQDGPGRCGVLKSPAMTVFVKTSQRFVDPTNASFDKDKWYDWSMNWIFGNATQPPKKGFISALWDLLNVLVESFVYRKYLSTKGLVTRATRIVPGASRL